MLCVMSSITSIMHFLQHKCQEKTTFLYILKERDEYEIECPLYTVVNVNNCK